MTSWLCILIYIPNSDRYVVIFIILVSISLMANDDENFLCVYLSSKCHLPSHVSSCLSSSLVFYCWSLRLNDILDTSSLSDMWFETFSPITQLIVLFILLPGSFAKQNIFHCYTPNLSIFSFTNCSCSVTSKNPLLVHKYWSFLLCWL